MEGTGGSRRRIIRPFRFPDDYPAVIDLWEHAGPGVHLGRSDTLDEIAKKVQRDPDLFLVAEVDGKLIGAVIGGYDGRRGIIYHLAVAKEYRRQGLGAALMVEVEGRMKAKGCVKSYLLVAPDNEDAVDFYAKRGWEVMDMTLMGKEF